MLRRRWNPLSPWPIVPVAQEGVRANARIPE
jgi:hypothetical protein